MTNVTNIEARRGQCSARARRANATGSGLVGTQATQSSARAADTQPAASRVIKRRWSVATAGGQGHVIRALHDPTSGADQTLQAA